jgi:hypothetical protein
LLPDLFDLRRWQVHPSPQRFDAALHLPDVHMPKQALGTALLPPVQ